MAAEFKVVYLTLWWSTSGSLAWDPSFKGDLGITVLFGIRVVRPKYDDCLALILSTIDVWHLVVSLIDVFLNLSRLETPKISS